MQPLYVCWDGLVIFVQERELITMKLDHIVIAIDSFKGSLSSLAAGQAAQEAVLAALPEAVVEVFPLADGGEGTVDTLVEGLQGTIVSTTVTGPLATPVASRYGRVPEAGLAVIEMADAAGLTKVPLAKRNPLHTTTYGLGELILQAMEDGCRDFIIGIGGSATNDCGLGMLTALGWKFYKADGKLAGICGGNLTDVAAIDGSQVDERLKECRFRIACDVTNPLYGEQGCSVVFGPQKGASEEIVKSMDEAIHRFADLVERMLPAQGADVPGAGAAGGLGFAFQTFLGGELIPGTELCLETIGIRRALKTADLLITGEGRMDGQTAMGKGPAGVGQLAHALHAQVKTVAVCGCALPDAELVNQHGIDAYFPILHMPMTVEEAMEEKTTRLNLKQTVTQILRLLK
ncbi:glycerate kinase [Selenomonas sp. WCT3]|nr:glycerate kinase [Selenomonas ruminantium]